MYDVTQARRVRHEAARVCTSDHHVDAVHTNTSATIVQPAVASELWYVPPSSGIVPPPPSQRCGSCQNFKQTTLTTRLYKVRTNLCPHLRKRSDAPVNLYTVRRLHVHVRRRPRPSSLRSPSRRLLSWLSSWSYTSAASHRPTDRPRCWHPSRWATVHRGTSPDRPRRSSR